MCFLLKPRFFSTLNSKAMAAMVQNQTRPTISSIKQHNQIPQLSIHFTQKKIQGHNIPTPFFPLWKKTTIQESYNTPLEHTPGNPPFANYERIPIVQLVGKGCFRGVFQRCGVGSQPQKPAANPRQPIWKIFVKMDHFPRDRGKHKK